MAQRFNGDEILAIAEQIERNGAAFYRRAAGPADGEVRELLLQLAGMEDEHERIFARMRADLADRDWAAKLDPDGDAELYLQAFAAGYIFDAKANPAEKLSGAESPAQILQTAIGLEKDSIVFYLGIKQVVPEDQGKDRIDDILREEMSHVSLLTGQLAGAGR